MKTAWRDDLGELTFRSPEFSRVVAVGDQRAAHKAAADNAEAEIVRPIGGGYRALQKFLDLGDDRKLIAGAKGRAGLANDIGHTRACLAMSEPVSPGMI